MFLNCPKRKILSLENEDQSLIAKREEQKREYHQQLILQIEENKRRKEETLRQKKQEQEKERFEIVAEFNANNPHKVKATLPSLPQFALRKIVDSLDQFSEPHLHLNSKDPKIKTTSFHSANNLKGQSEQLVLSKINKPNSFDSASHLSNNHFNNRRESRILLKQVELLKKLV